MTEEDDQRRSSSGAQWKTVCRPAGSVNPHNSQLHLIAACILFV